MFEENFETPILNVKLQPRYEAGKPAITNPIGRKTTARS